MFGWFKRKPHIPVFDGPRYPNAEEAAYWMYERVRYFTKYYPDNAHKLFDPSSGDYIPLAVHVGSCWNQDRQTTYRGLKAGYPELVIEAKKSFKQFGQYSQSRVGDLEDFDPDVRLLP